MKRPYNIKTLVILLISFSAFIPTSSFADTEYVIGGSYRFSGQSPFSDDPTLDLGLSIQGGLLYDEAHEVGLGIIYDMNWEEDTDFPLLIDTYSFIPHFYYRFHVFLTDEDASYPTIFYFGPNLGIAQSSSLAGFSGIKFMMGGSFGVNIFLARNIAIDLMVLSANKLWGERAFLIDQALGLKFIF